MQLHTHLHAASEHAPQNACTWKTCHFIHRSVGNYSGPGLTGRQTAGGTHHLRAPGGACLPRGRADAGLRGQLRDFARTEGPCAARRPAQDSGHATERARPQRCTLPLTYT